MPRFRDTLNECLKWRLLKIYICHFPLSCHSGWDKIRVICYMSHSKVTMMWIGVLRQTHCFVSKTARSIESKLYLSLHSHATKTNILSNFSWKKLMGYRLLHRTATVFFCNFWFSFVVNFIFDWNNTSKLSETQQLIKTIQMRYYIGLWILSLILS